MNNGLTKSLIHCEVFEVVKDHCVHHLFLGHNRESTFSQTNADLGDILCKVTTNAYAIVSPKGGVSAMYENGI